MRARTMLADLAETLPLAQRLALSYAPRGVREANLALLALDQRLAAILRAGGEPALAQIKLAWWRERLAEPVARWPEGEPLLALLRTWPGGPAVLGGVVDGWEQLLADQLDEAAIAGFADGRAAGWQALGGARAGLAGRRWALADLLLHLDDGDEATAVRAALLRAPAAPRLARAVRPLAVLHTLAARALRRDTRDLLDGPGALACAMRVGIIGR